LLTRFQGDYQSSVDVVVSALRDRLHITETGLFDGVALTASSRPAKTLETLRDKLRRGLPLRTIQDIVGIRIVGDMHLSQQDDLAEAIARCFEGARVDRDDRRIRPSFGYRAVHVIPHVVGFPVEIQIRTGWQDTWAQGSEKLGDVWGRWHRYGLPPEGPTQDERDRRARWISEYIRMGDRIYDHELALNSRFRLARRQEELLGLGGDERAEASAELSRTADLLREAAEEVIATNRKMANQMNTLVSVAGLESAR